MMRRQLLLRSVVLLAALLVAACGAPEASTPPTLAPPSRTLRAAISATTIPPTQLTSTATDGVCPQNQPNAVEGCISVVTETPLPSLPPSPTAKPPPPTPAVPLDQALRQFTGNALLYTALEGRLMLAGTTGQTPLWLNAQLCPPPDTIDSYGRWSADGRFIALACQDDSRQGVGYILDMRSGSARMIGSGPAITFEWSPFDSHLLVNAQDAQVGPKTYLVDATTGATQDLPATAAWSGLGPSPMVQGFPDGNWYPASTRALMSWSPDGHQIAVNATGDLYLLDAGTLHIRQEFNQGYAGIPRWSQDAREIFITQFVLKKGTPDPLSPSSQMPQLHLVRVDVQTGATHEVSDPFGLPSWSPDGTWYVTRTLTSLSLYQADGTHVRTLPVNGLLIDVAWTHNSEEIILMTYSPGADTRITGVDRAGHERTIVADGVNGIPFLEGVSMVSPDNTLLALTLNPSANPRIGIYDLQGHQQAAFSGVMVMGWRPGQ